MSALDVRTNCTIALATSSPCWVTSPSATASPLPFDRGGHHRGGHARRRDLGHGGEGGEVNDVGSDLMLRTGIEDQRARLVARTQAEGGVEVVGHSPSF
jgi:hypothetical protein